MCQNLKYVNRKSGSGNFHWMNFRDTLPEHLDLEVTLLSLTNNEKLFYL